MRSLLQELENNESVLWLYMAGELPADDRAEVEQMLATDAALCDELRQLRSMHDSFTLCLDEVDGMVVPARVQNAAARRVGRLMAQHAARQALHLNSASEPERRTLGSVVRHLVVGRWVYPVGVAAAVLLAVAWWGQLPLANDVHPDRPGYAHLHRNPEPMPDLNANRSGTAPGKPAGASGSEPAGTPDSAIDDPGNRIAAGSMDATTGDVFANERAANERAGEDWGLELSSDSDGDRNMVAVSVGSLDVSSMFDVDSEIK